MSNLIDFLERELEQRQSSGLSEYIGDAEEALGEAQRLVEERDAGLGVLRRLDAMLLLASGMEPADPAEQRALDFAAGRKSIIDAVRQFIENELEVAARP